MAGYITVATDKAAAYRLQTGKVSVNTDEPKATLHVKASADMAGIIAPYVTGTTIENNTYGKEQEVAIAYVTDKTGGGNANQAQYVTEKGYYYFDAAAADNAGRWMRLVIGNPIKDNKVNWFYMPSVSIDASTTGAKQINLHEKYTTQFQNVPTGQNSTEVISSVPVIRGNPIVLLCGRCPNVNNY